MKFKNQSKILVLVTLCLVISTTLTFVGCEFNGKLLDDWWSNENANESPNQELLLTDVDDVIENYNQLDEIIAYMSDNFVTSETVRVRDIEMWNQLSQFYDTNPEILSLYGIKGVSIAYNSLASGDSLDIDVSIEYEMFMNILAVHYGNDTSSLTVEESAVYAKALGLVEDARENSDGFDTELALAFHDYLVDTIEYDHNYEYNDNAFNVYGALIEGLAVCQGYTQSYKLLLTLSGIDNIIVTGEAGGDPHTWNLVDLGYPGHWYHIDTTWNDQDDTRTYRYYGVNDDILSDSHTWNRDFYPSAVSLEQNYYRYVLDVAEDVEQLETLFGLDYSMGKSYMEFLCEFPVTVDDLAFANDYGVGESIMYSIIEYGDDYLLTILI